MQIRHGLISADSHVVLDRDAFTSRMSKAKWGDRIPHIEEAEVHGRRVERWMADGRPSGGVAHCQGLMHDRRDPERWEDVPLQAYELSHRLQALDQDGVDAEVLFTSAPAQFYRYDDSEFELACVQAYNDTVASWRKYSDRFIPLAITPYRSDIQTIVSEVERAVGEGIPGIVVLAEPSLVIPGAHHFTNPFWYPLWDVCQELDVPVNIHEAGGLAGVLTVPRWDGYTAPQAHTAFTSPTASLPGQIIPSLIFSGVMGRFPRLKWVFAESGISPINYARAACDHEWERRHLWTEGIVDRPSDMIGRQVYTTFWYEEAGAVLRNEVGLNNVMWESDYPHISSNYPRSWEFVRKSLAGVPPAEHPTLLYGNVAKLYQLDVELASSNGHAAAAGMLAGAESAR